MPWNHHIEPGSGDGQNVRQIVIDVAGLRLEATLYGDHTVE
jgi:hypothetical protein